MLRQMNFIHFYHLTFIPVLILTIMLLCKLGKETTMHQGNMKKRLTRKVTTEITTDHVMKEIGQETTGINHEMIKTGPEAIDDMIAGTEREEMIEGKRESLITEGTVTRVEAEIMIEVKIAIEAGILTKIADLSKSKMNKKNTYKKIVLH